MNNVVIVAAGRSALTRSPKGSFKELRPDDLAAFMLKGVLARVPQFSPTLVDDVILGCAMPELEQGMDVARVAALRAGLPASVAGLTLNRFCASGLEAIATAAAKLATGQADFVLAGGVESMTRVPFMGETLRPNDALSGDTWLGMGDAVERVAVEEGITREQCDTFALRSQQRAASAQASGKFEAEIVPITLPDGTIITQDEGIRAETTLEGLAGLKTPFGGVITAGNASQRSDGAAAVLMTTEALAQEHGLTPLARFVGYATAAVDPVHFGIAPAAAIPKLLQRTGVGLDQVGLIEFNEAFAAQALASQNHFPLDWERVNVNGGAIALGHPLGATGARQTVTLLYEAQRQNQKGRYGMVTMCAALGMGAAGLFEFL